VRPSRRTGDVRRNRPTNVGGRTSDLGELVEVIGPAPATADQVVSTARSDSDAGESTTAA
jgi:hypothetical protein